MDKTLKILKAMAVFILDIFILVTALAGMVGVYIYGPQVIAHIVG